MVVNGLLGMNDAADWSIEAVQYAPRQVATAT